MSKAVVNAEAVAHDVRVSCLFCSHGRVILLRSCRRFMCLCAIVPFSQARVEFALVLALFCGSFFGTGFSLHGPGVFVVLGCSNARYGRGILQAF